MHDGAVVVGTGVESVGEALDVLAPLRAGDVIEADPEIAIAIEAGLGVEESDCVAEFVDGVAEGAAIGEVHELLGAEHADVGTAAGIDGADGDVGGFGGALFEANEGAALPVLEGLGDASGIAEEGVEGVDDGGIGPAVTIGFDDNGGFAGDFGGVREFDEHVAVDEAPALIEAVFDVLAAPNALLDGQSVVLHGRGLGGEDGDGQEAQ